MTIRKVGGYGAGLGANTFTGAQVAPSLALGGATIGSNALAVTGNAVFNTAVVVSPNGFYINSASAAYIALNGRANGDIVAFSTGRIGFTLSGTNANGVAPDAYITRDGVGALSMRDGGTNLSAVPQTFRVYNFYTDASNYERVDLTYATNVATLQSVAAGTGTVRNLSIIGGGSGGSLTLLGGGTTLDVTANSINMYRNGSSNQTTLNISGTSLTSTAQLFTRLTPTINQTVAPAAGTYTVLDINPTETSIGAGPHYFVKGRLGAGINVFGIKNDGSIQSGDPTNGVQFKNNGGVEAVFTRADGTTAILVKAGQFRSTGGTLAAAASASGAGAGAITYVTDATATTPRSIAAGGGANKVMVWSDGTNWLIF